MFLGNLMTLRVLVGSISNLFALMGIAGSALLLVLSPVGGGTLSFIGGGAFLFVGGLVLGIIYCRTFLFIRCRTFRLVHCLVSSLVCSVIHSSAFWLVSVARGRRGKSRSQDTHHKQNCDHFDSCVTTPH